MKVTLSERLYHRTVRNVKEIRFSLDILTPTIYLTKADGSEEQYAPSDIFFIAE
jgi:hypothetical protein